MGAWDTGPFENDDAADFAAQLVNAPRWEVVKAALNTALAADYLEAPEASSAIAAAAIVAAVRSGDKTLVPTDLHGVLPLFDAPSAELRVLASEAVNRVAQNSELAELWAEAEEGHDLWLASLSAIGEKL